MTTLDQMMDLLDALEARLPRLLASSHTEGEFWMAFIGEANVIEDLAGSHSDLVSHRINEMLGRHGRYLVGVEAEQ